MKDVFIMGTITVRSKTRNAGSLAIRNEELGMDRGTKAPLRKY